MTGNTKAMKATLKNVIILGAGSQIAPFLTTRLGHEGWTGMIISRRPPPSSPPLHASFRWESYDLRSNTLPVVSDCGIVICLAPIWLLGAIVTKLGNPRHIIAFSSTSVLTKSDSTDPHERRLAKQLANGEQLLQKACNDAGISWTILRPTLIYGIGRDHNVTAIAHFIQRYGFFPVARPGKGLRQPVHADDLAMAAVAAIDNPKALNRVFNLPGSETLPYHQMAKKIARFVDKRPVVLPIPLAVLRTLFRLFGPLLPAHYSIALFSRMNEDLVFDASEARAALDYTPRPFTGLE